MAGITYPLAVPNVEHIGAMEWNDVSIVGMTVSPYTGSQEIQQHQGQWWELNLAVLTLERADADLWAAFRKNLNGVWGTFLWGDPTKAVPRGSAAAAPGTPVVDGAGQSGNQLNLKGLPAGAGGYLLPGDFIQLGSGLQTRLHQVTLSVDADAGGLATAQIWPKLRESPADAAPLIVANTVGIWRQRENRTGLAIEPGPDYTPSGLAAVEAL